MRGSLPTSHANRFAVSLRSKPSPLIVLDTIALAWGGQKMVEARAYYRWPAAEWKEIKSRHYRGISTASGYWPIGAYGGGYKKAAALPFWW